MNVLKAESKREKEDKRKRIPKTFRFNFDVFEGEKPKRRRRK